MDNYEELKKLIKEKSELEKQLEKLQKSSPKVTVDENGQVNASEVNSAVDYSDQIKFLPTHIKDLQDEIDNLADKISQNENKTKEDVLKEVNDQIEKEKQERIDLNNLLKDLFYYKTYANYLNETSKKAEEIANETDKSDAKRNFLKISDNYHKKYEEINKKIEETYNKILETKKFTSKEDIDNYLTYDISIVPFIQYLLDNNYINNDTTIQLFNQKIKDITTKKADEDQITKSLNDLKNVCFLVQNSKEYFKKYIDEYQDTISKDETTVLPNNEETTVLDRSKLKKANNSNNENNVDLNKKADALLDKLMDRKLSKDYRRTFVIDYMHLIDDARKIENDDLANKIALDFNNAQMYYEFGDILDKIKNAKTEDENKLIDEANTNIQEIRNANDDAYNDKNALADLLTNELNDVLKEKEIDKAKNKKIEEDQNIANNDGNSYFVVDNGGSYDIIPAGFNVLDLSKKQEIIDNVNNKYNLNLTFDNTNLYAFGVKQNDKMIFSGEHTYYESIGDYVTLFVHGNKKVMLLGEKTINKQANEPNLDSNTNEPDIDANIDNQDLDNSDTKNPYETTLMNPNIKKKGKLKLVKENISNILKKHPVITKIVGAVAGVAIVAALSSNIVSCVRNQMQTPDQNPTIEDPQNNDDNNQLDKSEQLVYTPVNEHFKVYTSKYLENEDNNSTWFSPFKVLDVFDENGDLVINNPTEEDLEKLESTGKTFVCRCVGVNKTSTGYGYEGYLKLSTVTNFAKNGYALNYKDLVNHYDEIPNLREFDQLGKKGKTL